MSSNRRIIVITMCGKQGSGKTTAGKYLIDKHGYTHIRFANGLKKMLRDGLGIDNEYIDGSKKMEPCPELCGRTARHAMMTLGTEWGRRKIHKDIWVMALYRDMKRLVNEGITKFVIDDLRFLSEEAWLRSLQVKSEIPALVRIVKLERDGVILSEHQSEKEMEKIKADWTIYNNDLIGNLERSLDDILKCEGLLITKTMTLSTDEIKGGN